jgi:CRP/FNR family cyclic AMP-dependent transcriptional regulator
MRTVLYIFGLLTDADVAWIAGTGIRRHLRDGDVVIKQGIQSDSVIILLEGEFQITTRASGHVASVGVGEIVGEISLVDSAPPSATVTARGECLALFVDKKTLVQKLEWDVAFGCRFYRALAMLLADRLRSTLQLPSHSEAGLGDATIILQDELDLGILDASSASGERFTRMLKLLMDSEISGAPSASASRSG